jgi:hypothetical protein
MRFDALMMFMVRRHSFVRSEWLTKREQRTGPMTIHHRLMHCEAAECEGVAVLHMVGRKVWEIKLDIGLVCLAYDWRNGELCAAIAFKREAK